MKMVMVVLMVFLCSYADAKEVENNADGGQIEIGFGNNDVSKDINISRDTNISIEENTTFIDGILELLNINPKDKK